MFGKTVRITSLVLMALCLAFAAPPATADEALNKAFDTLKTYDWGSDRAALKPIDDAVAASAKDAAARKELEGLLASTVTSDVSQAAKDFCCRKLSLVGSAGCVASVAPLLTDEKLSHMARYALERIPDDAALQTLRSALPKVNGRLKVGVINSLGARRDAASTALMVELLSDSDTQIASASAGALGEIGTGDAAKALGAFQAKAPESLKLAAADAYLACAEQLLAAGNKTQATMIYRTLMKSEIRQVKLAAQGGLLATLRSK